MFKKIKEIRSKTGKLHFIRWNIFSIGNVSVNLHAIYKEDEDRDLHNHPWEFISIVLKGSYWELYSKRLGGTPYSKCNRRGFLNIARRNTNSFHKIFSLETPVVYTLNFMWGERKEWGYDVQGKLIQHEEYRKLKREGNL